MMYCTVDDFRLTRLQNIQKHTLKKYTYRVDMSGMCCLDAKIWVSLNFEFLDLCMEVYVALSCGLGMEDLRSSGCTG